MTETGREQDMLYMEELERVTEERDRLREALEMFINLTDVQKHYPLEVNLARAALKDVDDGR